MSNQTYYDDFSHHYDAHRGNPYHRLLDELELSLLDPLVRHRRVLDVATGTGLLLMALKERAQLAVGVDLSAGMLQAARRRQLTVLQGSAEALPIPDESFDVACCFKAFPHLQAPRRALCEMRRVVRPAGSVVVELYNPLSFRGLLRRFGPRRRISTAFDEGDVHTRYDSLARFVQSLPDGLAPAAVHGIRVITPAGGLLSVPLLGSGLARLERLAFRAPEALGLWRLAGFIVVTLTRT